MILVALLGQFFSLILGLGAIIVVLIYHANHRDKRATRFIYFLASYLFTVIILNIPVIVKNFAYHYALYSEYLYYYLFLAYSFGLVFYTYSSFVFELVDIQLSMTQRRLIFWGAFLPLYDYIPIMIWGKTVYDLCNTLYVLGVFLILTSLLTTIVLIQSYQKLIGLRRKISLFLIAFTIIYLPFAIIELFFPDLHLIMGGSFTFYNLFFMILNFAVILNALLVTLHKIHRDIEYPVNAEISPEILKLYGISERESEIAVAILEGKTNNEIAQEKFISITTVKKHVYNIFQKTNARNRIELTNILRNGK